MTAPTMSQRARMGAFAVHAKYGGHATTAKARAVYAERWERMVDPDGSLDPVERAKRAASARRLHMLKLAMLSARARKG